jgi:hypothetical protein
MVAASVAAAATAPAPAMLALAPCALGTSSAISPLGALDEPMMVTSTRSSGVWMIEVKPRCAYLSAWPSVSGVPALRFSAGIAQKVPE